MQKIFLSVIIFLTMIVAGCEGNSNHISQDEAIEMMKSDTDILIVDVRTQEEYAKRHIPSALLVPIEDLRAGNFSALPDKNKKMLLYCWTGRRAEDSVKILIENGYTDVHEFGGLVDWKGEVEGTEAE